MKQRILSGWTFTRAIYLLMGIMVIIQSSITNQWAGVLFGGYFASMGLLGYGCAGGNCNLSQQAATKNEDSKEVTFKEL